MPMSNSSAILTTLAYFDTFDFALTPEEIFRFLWNEKADLQDCYGILRKLADEGVVETKDSYYFFPGRSSTVKRRQESVVPTEDRLRRAQLATRLIRWVPFVRAIFVCNSVASEMAVAKSDIDFFIVTAEGRIWLVRFYANLILKLFGLRTHEGHSAGHICLSFFVSEKNLNLAPWRIANDDIYLALWLKQLLPIYDPEQKMFKKIQNENTWVNELFPNANFGIGKLPDEIFWRNGFIKKLKEWSLRGYIGNFLEKQLKRWQVLNLRPELKELANEGGVGVVLSDGILKFHSNDARAQIRKKWLEKCNVYAKIV